jgi:integrase
VRGGFGSVTRSAGVPGGILTYGSLHFRNRRLAEAEYRSSGESCGRRPRKREIPMTTDIILQIALTGCRCSEVIRLQWTEIDMPQRAAPQ